MSVFARLSMGLRFGVRAVRAEPLTPVQPGSRWFFSFSGSIEAQSERLPDEPAARRGVSLRFGAAGPEARTATEQYWSAPWRRGQAPAAFRGPTIRVVWSTRAGM